MMKKVLEKDFVRNVVVLISGTLLAQILTYLLSPLISRLYNEEQMADLGIYLRIVAFLSVLATARFELTLPLPKSDHHSFLLYRLAIRIAKIFFIIAIILGIIYAFTFEIEFDFILLLFFSLISTFFLVYINLGTTWAIRHKKFKSISNQRIVNSALTNFLKLGIGLIGFSKWGLIISTTLGTVISSLGFIKTFLVKRKSDFSLKSNIKTKLLVKEYKNIPLISFPHVIIDLGRDLLMAFLIVLLFGKENFGSFTFAMMLLSIPIAFIGQSIGQVFFNKASEMSNNNESILPLVVNNFKILFLISILPFTLLFMYGEELFILIFGQNWGEAGKMAEIMAPWLMMNFIVSPFSNLPVILNRQKESFFIGLGSTILQIVSICIFPLFLKDLGKNMNASLILLTYSQITMLIIASLFYFKIAKVNSK